MSRARPTAIQKIKSVNNPKNTVFTSLKAQITPKIINKHPNRTSTPNKNKPSAIKVVKFCLSLPRDKQSRLEVRLRTTAIGNAERSRAKRTLRSRSRLWKRNKRNESPRLAEKKPASFFPRSPSSRTKAEIKVVDCGARSRVDGG